MKKLLSIILTLAVAMSMSVTVFAATINEANKSDTADVTATYKVNETATVYSVDISWEGLNFTYNGSSEGTWNPTTHEYENPIVAGWVEGSGTLTVTNHSNTDITAKPSYTAKEGYTTTGMTFDKTEVVVGSAATENKAVVGTITVTPNGTLPETAVTSTTIGTITVTIK